MEDAATAEISRTQIWQWIKHGAALDDGRTVTRALVAAAHRGRVRAGESAPRARALFEAVATSDELADFLTLPAYEILVKPVMSVYACRPDRVPRSRARRQDRGHPSRTEPHASPTATCANQVTGVAEQLAAAGVGRGDRVGIALPNGLPMIVSFLAAGDGRHGGAAQSRATRKTSSGSISRTPTREGAAAAARRRRRSAPRGRRSRCPILTIDMDAAGTVSLSRRRPAGKPVAPPAVDDVALVLHTSGSTGRPKRVPLAHANLSISAQQRRAQLRARRRRCVAVRDAAVPRPRPGGVDAGDARRRAAPWSCPAKFNPLSFWRVGARSRRHLVFGGADACTSCCSRAPNPARAAGRRAPRSCASSARAARRCRRR